MSDGVRCLPVCLDVFNCDVSCTAEANASGGLLVVCFISILREICKDKSSGVVRCFLFIEDKGNTSKVVKF